MAINYVVITLIIPSEVGLTEQKDRSEGKKGNEAFYETTTGWSKWKCMNRHNEVILDQYKNSSG